MNMVVQRSAVVPLRTAVALSSGIRAIRHIAHLAGVDEVLSPTEARRQGRSVDCVLVWGRKASAEAAERYAVSHQLPVRYLEDGWIRSCARDAHSRLSYSMIVDDTGVYYDGDNSSDIERHLNLPDHEFDATCDAEALCYARRCREQLIRQNVTKYNFCLPPDPAAMESDKPLVLLVDQTRDDASVRHGGMDESSFVNMLDAACRENPGARIVVRTHPDVVGGRREGYLKSEADRRGIEILAVQDNPIPWLKLASRVYVGTSQLGYEALLCGTSVVVFGKPFYAGWGLTDDRQPLPVRRTSRSVDQLFHVAHVARVRYCNPVTGQPWQLHDCLEHVVLQQREFARNAHDHRCVGITRWKRRYVQQFLRSPSGSVSFDANKHKPNDATRWLTWGYRRFPVPLGSAGRLSESSSLGDRRSSDGVVLPVDAPAAADIVRMEDGFLRSSGLGSDLNAPASLVVDTRGLYLDASHPSDLEHLLSQRDCTPAELERARELIELINEMSVTKYNVGVTGNVIRGPADKKCVLVVGQVEDDESVRRGCLDVASNTALLQAVRDACPDAWILYKPHPDVAAGNRQGRVDSAVLDECVDAVEEHASILDCLEGCEELHTMTSLSGFEALLRGKSVVAYGMPFYAGWGLTTDRHQLARRTRKRTLEELVFCSLIEYPRYVDIETGEFSTPEDLVFTLKRQTRMNIKKPVAWSARQINKAVNMVRGLRYAP